MLALAVGGYLRLKWMRSVGATTNAAQAVVDAVTEGGIDDEGIAFLMDHGVDEETARLLNESTDVKEVARKCLAIVQDQNRGGPDEGFRLLSPKAGITDLRPELRFAPPPGRVSGNFTVRLYDDETPSPIFREQVEPSSGRSGPPTEDLVVGKRYYWNVTSRDGLYEDRASFHVVDPARKEEVLSALQPMGDPALETLARAAALLSLELAEDCLKELKNFPESATEEAGEVKRILEARAYVLLKDQVKVEELLSSREGARSSSASDASQAHLGDDSRHGRVVAVNTSERGEVTTCSRRFFLTGLSAPLSDDLRLDHDLRRVRQTEADSERRQRVDDHPLGVDREAREGWVGGDRERRRRR